MQRTGASKFPSFSAGWNILAHTSLGSAPKNGIFMNKFSMVCSQLMATVATVAPPGEFRQRRCHNFRGLNSEYSQSFNTFNNLQYSSSNSCLLTECLIKIVKELQCMSILNKFLKTFEMIKNSLFTLLNWSLVTFLTEAFWPAYHYWVCTKCVLCQTFIYLNPFLDVYKFNVVYV